MDSIGDALIRIKNGYTASKKEVDVKYSKLIERICQLLAKEGYVQSCKQEGLILKVTLKYDGKSPAMTDVRRISKPGLRIYRGVNRLQRVMDGFGIAIISTPKGVMADREARKQNVGGEVLAEVW